MRHIFILQGKKFISSKRASKISDYSSDYIGQLCRAGKLECKRVGHAWFVTEDSLSAHKAGVKSDDALKDRIRNITGKDDKDKIRNFGDWPVVSEEKSRITSARASEISGYARDYVGQLCRSGKLDGKLVGNAWMIAEDSLYELMAEKAEQTKAALESPSAIADEIVPDSGSKNILKIGARAEYGAALPEAVIASPRPSYTELTRNIILKRALAAALVIVVMVTAMSISFVPGRNSAVADGRGAVASVWSAFQSALAFFGESAHKIASLFGHGQQLSMNVPSSGGSSLVPEYGGIAVAPSTGSAPTDDEMKQDIRASFSDQVAVSPDKSGTAGVITPVFREAKGKDFIYVMVPVKSAKPISDQSR